MLDSALLAAIEVVRSQPLFEGDEKDNNEDIRHISIELPSPPHSIYLNADPEDKIICLLDDLTLMTFDLVDGKERAKIALSGEVRCIAPSKADPRSLAVLSGKSITLYDIRTLDKLTSRKIDAVSFDWFAYGQVVALNANGELSSMALLPHAPPTPAEFLGKVPYHNPLEMVSIHAPAENDIIVLAYDPDGPEMLPFFAHFSEETEESLTWSVGMAFSESNTIEEDRRVAFVATFAPMNAVVVATNLSDYIETFQFDPDESGSKRWKHFQVKDAYLAVPGSETCGLAVGTCSDDSDVPVLVFRSKEALERRPFIECEECDFSTIMEHPLPVSEAVDDEEFEESDELDEDGEEDEEEGELDLNGDNGEEDNDAGAPLSLEESEEDEEGDIEDIKTPSKPSSASSSDEPISSSPPTSSSSTPPPTTTIVEKTESAPTTTVAAPQPAKSSGLPAGFGAGFSAAGGSAKFGSSTGSSFGAPKTTTTPPVADATTPATTPKFGGFGTGFSGFGKATAATTSPAASTTTTTQPGATKGFGGSGFGGFAKSTTATSTGSPAATTGFGVKPTFGKTTAAATTAPSETKSSGSDFEPASEESKKQAASDAALLGPPGGSAAPKTSSPSEASEESKKQAASDAALLGPPGSSTPAKSSSSPSEASEESKAKAAADAFALGPPPGASKPTQTSGFKPAVTSIGSTSGSFGSPSATGAATNTKFGFGAATTTGAGFGSGASSSFGKSSFGAKLATAAPAASTTSDASGFQSGASEESKAKAASDAALLGPPGGSSGPSSASEESKKQAAADAFSLGPPGAAVAAQNPSSASEASKAQASKDAALLGPPGSSAPSTSTLKAPSASDDPSSASEESKKQASADASLLGPPPGAAPKASTPAIVATAPKTTGATFGFGGTGKTTFGFASATTTSSPVAAHTPTTTASNLKQASSDDNPSTADEASKVQASLDAFALGPPPGASKPTVAPTNTVKPTATTATPAAGTAPGTAGFGPSRTSTSSPVPNNTLSTTNGANAAAVATPDKKPLAGPATVTTPASSVKSPSSSANLALSSLMEASSNAKRLEPSPTKDSALTSPKHVAPSAAAAAAADASSLFTMLLEKNAKQIAARSESTKSLSQLVSDMSVGAFSPFSRSEAQKLSDDLDARIGALSMWTQALDARLEEAEKMRAEMDSFQFTASQNLFAFRTGEFDIPEVQQQESERRSKLLSTTARTNADFAELNSSFSEAKRFIARVQANAASDTPNSTPFSTPAKYTPSPAGNRGIPAHLQAITSPVSTLKPTSPSSRSKNTLATTVQIQGRRIQDLSTAVKRLKLDAKKVSHSVASMQSRPAPSLASKDSLTIDQYIPEKWSAKAVQKVGKQAKWVQLEAPLWQLAGKVSKGSLAPGPTSGSSAATSGPINPMQVSVSSNGGGSNLMRRSSSKSLNRNINESSGSRSLGKGGTGESSGSLGSGSTGATINLMRSSLKSSQVVSLRKTRSRSSYGSKMGSDSDGAFSDFDEEDDDDSLPPSVSSGSLRASLTNHSFGIKPRKIVPLPAPAKPTPLPNPSKTAQPTAAYSTTTTVSAASTPSTAGSPTVAKASSPNATATSPSSTLVGSPSNPHLESNTSSLGIRVPLAAPSSAQKSVDSGAKPPPAPLSPPFVASKPSGVGAPPPLDLAAKATSATATATTATPTSVAKTPAITTTPAAAPAATTATNTTATGATGAPAATTSPATAPAKKVASFGMGSKPAAFGASTTPAAATTTTTATSPSASPATAKAPNPLTITQKAKATGFAPLVKPGTTAPATTAATTTTIAPAATTAAAGTTKAGAIAPVKFGGALGAAKISSAGAPKTPADEPIVEFDGEEEGEEGEEYEEGEEGEELEEDDGEHTPRAEDPRLAKKAATPTTPVAAAPAPTVAPSAAKTNFGFAANTKFGAPAAAKPTSALGAKTTTAAAPATATSPVGAKVTTPTTTAATTAAPAAGATPKTTFGASGFGKTVAAKTTAPTTTAPAATAPTTATAAAPKTTFGFAAKTTTAAAAAVAPVNGFGKSTTAATPAVGQGAMNTSTSMNAPAASTAAPVTGGWAKPATTFGQNGFAKTTAPAAAAPVANGFGANGFGKATAAAPAASGFGAQTVQQGFGAVQPTGFQNQAPAGGASTSWTQRAANNTVAKPTSAAPAGTSGFGSGFSAAASAAPVASTGWAAAAGSGFAHSFSGGAAAATSPGGAGAGFGQRSQLGGGSAAAAYSAKPTGMPAGFGAAGFSGKSAGGFSGAAAAATGGGSWAGGAQTQGFGANAGNFGTARR